MAYVKLKKAAGDFDILSSENVASVKLATSTEDGLLVVNFIGDLTNNITIKPVGWVVGTVSTHFVQADVTALNKPSVPAKSAPASPPPVSMIEAAADFSASIHTISK